MLFRSITVKYDGATTIPTNAGTYAITVDVAATENFEAKTGIELGNYTISKKSITVTLTDREAVYTGSEITVNDLKALPEGTSAYSTNDIVTGDDVTITPEFSVASGITDASETAYTDAIDATVTLSGTSAENYDADNITVTSADLKVVPAELDAPEVDDENLVFSTELTIDDVKFVTGTKAGWGWKTTTQAIKAGENVYTAEYTGIDANNYTEASKTANVKFNVQKGTLTSADFLLKQDKEVYGTVSTKGAIVTSQNSSVEDTAITAKYYDGSETIPSLAKTYKVTIDVAATDNYNAINGLEVGSFVIDQAVLSAPVVNEENLVYSEGMKLFAVPFTAETKTGWKWEVADAEALVVAGSNTFTDRKSVV